MPMPKRRKTEIRRNFLISRPKTICEVARAKPITANVRDSPKIRARGPNRGRCQALERKIGIRGKAQGFKRVKTPAIKDRAASVMDAPN
jgi:hypothetical protein